MWKTNSHPKNKLWFILFIQTLRWRETFSSSSTSPRRIFCLALNIIILNKIHLNQVRCHLSTTAAEAAAEEASDVESTSKWRSWRRSSGSLRIIVSPSSTCRRRSKKYQPPVQFTSKTPLNGTQHRFERVQIILWFCNNNLIHHREKSAHRLIPIQKLLISDHRSRALQHNCRVISLLMLLH